MSNNIKDHSNELYIFFVLISFLYLFFFPAAGFLGGYINYNEVIYSKSSQLEYLIYIFSFPFAPLIASILFNSNKTRIETINVKSNNDVKLNTIYKLAQFLSLLYIIYLYLYSGVDFSTLFNRVNRENDIFQSQSWVVLVMYIQSVVFCGFFYWESLSKLQKIQCLMIFIGFSIFEIVGLGARRYTIAMAIFWIYKNGYFTFLLKSIKGFFVLLVSIFIAIFYGAFREIIFYQVNGITERRYFLDIMAGSNEFTEIGYGFARSVNYVSDISFLRLGSSFFQFILYFIPREFYPDKPLSLSNELNIPISLFSELYINFHLASLFLWIYIFYYIRKLSEKGPKLFLPCIIGAYSLDFIRADTSTIIYTITFALIFYLLFTFNLSRRSTFSPTRYDEFGL